MNDIRTAAPQSEDPDRVMCVVKSFHLQAANCIRALAAAPPSTRASRPPTPPTPPRGGFPFFHTRPAVANENILRAVGHNSSHPSRPSPPTPLRHPSIQLFDSDLAPPDFDPLKLDENIPRPSYGARSVGGYRFLHSGQLQFRFGFNLLLCFTTSIHYYNCAILCVYLTTVCYV